MLGDDASNVVSLVGFAVRTVQGRRLGQVKVRAALASYPFLASDSLMIGMRKTHVLGFRIVRRDVCLQSVDAAGPQGHLIVTHTARVRLLRPESPAPPGAPPPLQWQHQQRAFTYRVPLVAPLVAAVDTAQRAVTVDLPSGIVQLGREEMYLDMLEEELQPFLESCPNPFRAKVPGQRLFPTCAQLHAAGRPDLVYLVTRAGGSHKACASPTGSQSRWS
jgi:hypothetical protein